ncbi:hypothetical protein [Bradyrhizobium arachidis]|uniref:Uncharacterized protein n=1 Tax=Bradyrhizobium arachidis TaxID=858423 RepID=A0AAE7THF8_9BRAD|nr:hypothetical protein [Bradyrhizobium arachidis]QOZ68858.1 hypothetical protein WN72_22925 [Bradyrhizobium arachidis]SFV19271.1 hypothetical protein SAMN05192541_14819 [Bradyrhizobium arachidis]
MADNVVRLTPISHTQRLLRVAMDAQFLVENLTAQEAASFRMAIEDARDNLSRLSDRAEGKY